MGINIETDRHKMLTMPNLEEPSTLVRTTMHLKTWSELKCIFNRHYFGEGDTEISYTNIHNET